MDLVGNFLRVYMICELGGVYNMLLNKTYRSIVAEMEGIVVKIHDDVFYFLG
jgi:hypothetical protein